jgi:hypothetical protein
MMAVLAIAIMAPLYFGAVATVQSASTLSAWLRDLPNQTPPALAEGLVRLPLVGPRFEKA